MRAIDIVSTSDDDGHLERAVVRLGKELSTSFGRGVGIGGFEDL